MEMEVKPVVETHAYPEYDGELVDIQTSKVDFRVTPNHRMLVRKNDANGITEDEWDFVEAGDLHDYCHYELPHDWGFDHENALGEQIDLHRMVQSNLNLDLAVADGGTKIAAKGGKPNISTQIPTGEFLELLAWYVAEGNVYEAKTGNYRVQFAQENKSQRREIESITESLVEYYYETDQDISFSSRIIGDLFRELCGSNSKDKQIPELVFDASRKQKKRFLKTLIKADGDRQPNSWRYSTKSKQLRDGVLRLCTHLGLTASYTRDSDTWRIYCTENGKNSFRMHRSGSRSTADDGVYCVTVADNNTLVAGRNGKFQNISNSLYGVLGWDRFRLYDREMGAAVTATGRDVIEFTQEVTNELDKEVIYGDSVTGERPVVVRDPDGRVRIQPIERLFERATPSEADHAILSVDGRPVTSIESSKEYTTLEGWDALSVNNSGRAEWRPIERVIRHETDKPVLRLQHKFGESVTTRDHAYIVDNGEGLIEASPDEVDSPLRIPDVPDITEVETIDVYEMLEGYEREYEDGRGSGGVTTKTKRVCADDDAVWFGHEHHRGLDKTVEVQRYIDLDSEDGEALLRLLGAYIPEGSASTVETTDTRFGASIAESNRDWLEQLQEDYYRLFENTTASIVPSDTRSERTIDYSTDNGETEVTYDDRTLKFQMMNELAAVFFREFAGQTSRGKRIPSFVFHLPAEKQDVFLQMLVEGDGSRVFPRYSTEYAERNFDFETTSRELAGGLSILLTQRDRKHSLKYRPEKDSYTIRTCDSYRSGRSPVLTPVEHDGYVYDLSVRENENFVDAVGGIVLHNTDSVMVSMGADAEKEGAIERSFEIEERINDAYDEFAREQLNAAEHRFEIEFEKLYRRFFQAGKKKRYAGHTVWKEGKDVDDIDITGFEYQRSDIAPITKEVQLEVIQQIVTGEELEQIKEYVTEVIEGFQTGEVDPEEIGIPGGIGKRLDNYDTDTAQVRGAKYANRVLGTNFQRGSKPKRIYIDRVHAGFFRRVEAENPELENDQVYQEFKRDPDVICFDYADQLPEEFEIDWEKMLDKTLKGPIERILEGLDVSWEEVKSGQDQTGLSEFM
jgi:DNA polymerase elongation subunit (family B)